jgi:ketosteroid isomerase-like protein
MKTKDIHFIKWILVSIILFGIIFLWNFQAFGQDWTVEQKEVWEVVVADYEKLKQGDIEGLLASRHDDIVIWWGNKPVPYDKKLIRTNYRGWFAYDIPTKWELEPFAIKIIGNVASVFFTYKYSGNILSGHARNLETWIKQDGKWLMINSFSATCDKLPPCK